MSTNPSFTLADGDSMVTNTLELMDIGYRDIERPGRTEIGRWPGRRRSRT